MLTRRTGYLTPLSATSMEQAPAASLQLEQRGFTVLKGVLGASDIRDLASEISQVYEDFPADARGAGARTAEVDQEFRYEMFNRSGLCQILAGHPVVLSVIEPLLGEDCHVIANTCWRNPPVFDQAADPGHGGGFWHIDAGPHVPRAADVPWPAAIPYPVFAIGAHVYLQDCPLACGPTGVIAGSHTSGQPPPRAQYDDMTLTWNGEGVTPLIASEGDVALFVSDVWHRRLPVAQGDTGRFFVQFHYARRDIAQRVRTTQQVNQLSPQAMARIGSEREAQLFGLHSARFYDG